MHVDMHLHAVHVHAGMQCDTIAEELKVVWTPCEVQMCLLTTPVDAMDYAHDPAPIGLL